MKRKELTQYLSEQLQPHLFQDYGPNGLQIEGNEDISNIAFAVSATKDSIQKAIAAKADTLIVHHGLFWKFHGVRTITNTFAKRVKPLIQNNINLFGYHLPLDAHIEFGNAASLAKLMGLSDLKEFGDYKRMPTGVSGKLPTPLTAQDFAKKLEEILSHSVLMSSHDANQKISSIGIITGGANGDWVHAQKQGLDAYITGEMSEHDWHEAQEGEVHMFAGGHHATEKFGIQSLQKKISDKFEVKTFFIDSSNPA